MYTSFWVKRELAENAARLAATATQMYMRSAPQNTGASMITSRSVPPPMAVMTPSTRTPKISMPRGATARTAVTAKATVPAIPIQ